MTKIKLNWAYAKGELDTDTLELVCIPARGKRVFGPDELDAELCIKDGMNYQIAEIHLGDVESSNVLCNEIARRWNEFGSRTDINTVWHDANEEPEREITKIVLFSEEDYEMETIYYAYDSPDDGWESIKENHDFSKWAYVEGLMPKGGKE